MNERRIKQFFHGLRFTPLHPQWPVFRGDESIRRMLAGYASGIVVDIGCADGSMRHHVPNGCHYIGLDYPDTAIDWYGTRPNIFANAVSLPFAPEVIDTVLLLDVLEHLQNPSAALIEIQRVLRPGGRLIIKVPCLYPVHDAPLDFRRWTIFGLTAELNEKGFVTEIIRGLGTPLETAMLLSNLGHAKYFLEGLRKHRPIAILMGFILFMITPLRNLVSWLAGHTSSNWDTMPYAIYAVVRKPL